MKRSISPVVAVCLAVAAALPAHAAGVPEGPSFLWAVVKMLLSLALVLAILLAISRASKNFLERYSRPGAPGKALAVGEIQRLGPKTQVLVLEAFGAKYLLALTPAGISVIDKIRGGVPERTIE